MERKKLLTCFICKLEFSTADPLLIHLKHDHTKQCIGEPKKQHEAKGSDQRKSSTNKPSVKHQSAKNVQEVRLKHLQTSDFFELFIFLVETSNKRFFE